MSLRKLLRSENHFDDLRMKGQYQAIEEFEQTIEDLLGRITEYENENGPID